MALPTIHALTEQFYEWERRGRGWHVSEFSCDLEPAFVPFFGHGIEGGDVIDDGRRPSFWNSLFSPGEPSERRDKFQERKEPAAYPYSGASNALTIYAVTLPRHFKQSRERIGEFLVMLSYRKSPVSFEIVGTSDRIILQFAVRDADSKFFHSQLAMFFPECGIRETHADAALDLMQGAECLYTVDFGLSEEFMRPLALLSNGNDPYAALFGILERLDDDEAAIIQVLFSGVHNGWGESIIRSVCDGQLKQSFFLDAPEMPQLAREKIAQPLFAVAIRAVTVSDTMEGAATLLRHVATAIEHASRSGSNELLALSEERYHVNVRLADIVMRETHRVGMLLNALELATFAHLPAIQSNKLAGSSAVTKAAPPYLFGHAYVLGRNSHQGAERPVSVPDEQRLRHVHVMGATGTGKSTLLKSLIMQDVEQGNGLCVLDPHGDLIDGILASIPRQRIGDVLLIDPSDAEFPVGLNILLAHSDIEKELLASDLVAVFRRFSTSWGDQMNSVFANAILAFVQNARQYHLGDLRRFLIEPAYRVMILSTVTDPEIAYYWQKEFPILKNGSIGSILTRLDSFLRPKAIRNMVCQAKSIDFAQLMDSQKIVLVKLSQGLMGTENSYLLGAFVVSKLQQTAMARQAQQAGSRIPFYVYIDEFHHFITPSMAAILSGARKYGVGLILAHQDIAQVQRHDAEVASSVLSNAGTRICFRLGDADARRLEDGFKGFTHEDLQSLATGRAIARVNAADADFNLEVVPSQGASGESHTDEIIGHSRNHYSIPIAPESAIPAQSAQPVRQPEPPSAMPVPIRAGDAGQASNPETVREHRYLQTFVKALAESQGYVAQLEAQTPDGTGQVDALLSRDGQRIAVEISVTTGPEWELHNIQKCLAAGYEKVVVCSSSGAKLKAIEALVKGAIPSGQRERIRLVTPDGFQGVLMAEPKRPATETVMKGYRVKVKYEDGGADRQDLLKGIIRASQKP